MGMGVFWDYDMVASIPVLVGEREAIGVFGVLCGWELVLNYTMSLRKFAY